jgi:hypothetical protein
MLRQHAMGVRLKDIIEALAGEYDVQEHALYQDWERRNRWVPQIIKLTDPTLMHQLIQGLQMILPRAWVIAESDENPFARLRALQLIKDTNLDLIKALQSIGFIAQRPIQVDERLVVIKGRWWEPDRRSEAGQKLQEDVKQAIREEASKGATHNQDERANISVS